MDKISQYITLIVHFHSILWYSVPNLRILDESVNSSLIMQNLVDHQTISHRLSVKICSKWALLKRQGTQEDHIFSCVRPFYEQAVSDLDRSMHRSLWV